MLHRTEEHRKDVEKLKSKGYTFDLNNVNAIVRSNHFKIRIELERINKFKTNGSTNTTWEVRPSSLSYDYMIRIIALINVVM